MTVRSSALATMSRTPLVAASSFLGSLSFQELQHLRKHIREKFMVGWPKHAQTDRECDRLIEVHGPRAKEAVLKKAIERKWGSQ